MPIINGLKMACEPCIRGHRSTNCPHAQSRLMVPVRKPGRPLSACPHPKTSPCNCGTVTAAIPRKQKCECGTSESHEKDEIKQEADSATNGVAQALTSPTASSHRVTKSTKNGSTRKQSIDVSKLERIDPSQVNVIASPDSQYAPNGGLPQVELSQNMYPMTPMAMAPNGNSSYAGTPMVYSSQMFTPQMGFTTPQMNETSSTNGGSPQNGTSAGGCCGGSRESSNPTSPLNSATASTNGDAPAVKSSCCSGKKAQQPTTATPDFAMANANMMPPFAPQMNMPIPGMYPFYPQPTIFTYPPQYGSFMQPLQPEQWRQFVANLGFAQSLQQQQAAANGTPVPNGSFDMSQMSFPPPGTTTMDVGTSHQCGCGEGCQCVGCAAHPYNDATQNYVRSAYNAMKEERGSQSATNGTNAMAAIPEQTTTTTKEATKDEAAKPAGGSCCGGGKKKADNGDGTVSPPAPQTPSSAASGIGEEQTLSASDFFFVSYPFGDCAGDMASCPCGDDCQCIGCEIHKVNVG